LELLRGVQPQVACCQPQREPIAFCVVGSPSAKPAESFVVEGSEVNARSSSGLGRVMAGRKIVQTGCAGGSSPGARMGFDVCPNVAAALGWVGRSAEPLVVRPSETWRWRGGMGVKAARTARPGCPVSGAFPADRGRSCSSWLDMLTFCQRRLR